MNPLPAQNQFWNSNVRHKAFVGGIGSGKTLAGVVEIVRQPAGTMGAVLAPTYPMLRDATQRTFFEHYQPWVLDHSKADNTTLLRNGTFIFWRSADEPNRLRGPNLNWFWLDEADYMDAGIWDVMLGRIRRPPVQRAWVTTSPDGLSGKGWVRHKIAEKVKRGAKDYALIRARTMDNYHLPVEYVESLRQSYTSEYARQELEGEFVDAIGKVMRREWIQHTNHIPEGTEFIVGVDLAVGMHKNADDRAIVVTGRHGTTYYVVDVLFGKWSFNQTKDYIIRTANNWNAVKVCVESVAYQEVMVQQLRAETMLNVVGVNPRGRNKLTRFLPVAGKYEHGYVKHVQNLPIDFVDQLLMFDGVDGRADDMVDALAYSINGHESVTYVYDI